MANTYYDNFVLESRFTDLLNTKLAVRSFMTIDNSLTSEPGMTKKINTYTYAGTVEKLAKGAKNTARGAVTIASTPYVVKLAQQVFDYFDEEVMTDPLVVDAGLQGMAQVMVNDFNTEYFAELAKATLNQTFPKGSAMSYDTVVDAIAKMNIESEEGLFLIIGNDQKAAIRKDSDFVSAKLGEIVFNGQIGSICGVPVVVSKLVPAKSAYLATNAAVTCFTKKDSEIEQERDGEARKNTVISRKVNLIALTDATKVVKISEALA